MSLGKLNTFIDIVSTEPTKDPEGFVTYGDNVLASQRAYKENRSGSEKWANMAAFSTATALFRFRKHPGLKLVSSLNIVCEGERYKILNVEDAYGRGMYWTVLAELVTPTKN
jgi:head-tail adaptor